MERVRQDKTRQDSTWVREDWAEKSAAGELILQKIRIETAKCNNILNTYIYLNTIFKIDIAFSNKTSENQRTLVL